MSLLSPKYHDQLARAISAVIHDNFFWDNHRFKLDAALPYVKTAARKGVYDKERLLNLLDDYMQQVQGGIPGVGVAGKASRGVSLLEIRASHKILKSLFPSQHAFRK